MTTNSHDALNFLMAILGELAVVVLKNALISSGEHENVHLCVVSFPDSYTISSVNLVSMQ